MKSRLFVGAFRDQVIDSTLDAMIEDSISTVDRAAQRRLTLGVGENGYGRLLAMGGSGAGELYVSGALECQSYAGPWTDIDEDVRKINGMLKIGGGDEAGNWSLSGIYYDNQWNAADQIPARLG